MKISIGTSLKTLRQKKGVTQEQAAEAFGVSPQAVSRWENDSAYPDITLLPGIAMFYNTSVDSLLGMDSIRLAEHLGEVHTKVQSLVHSGQIEAAAALLRENLRLYPGNTGLLLALAETLAHDPARTEEAVSAAETVLQSGELSLKARCTATVTLAFLYRRLGQAEKARRLLSALPHLWESRELLAPAFSPEPLPALQAAVSQTLALLCALIDSPPESDTIPAHIQLGADLASAPSPQAMLQKLHDFLNN